MIDCNVGPDLSNIQLLGIHTHLPPDGYKVQAIIRGTSGSPTTVTGNLLFTTDEGSTFHTLTSLTLHDKGDYTTNVTGPFPLPADASLAIHILSTSTSHLSATYRVSHFNLNMHLDF